MMKIKPVILFLFLLTSTGTLFAQHGTCGAKGDSVTWTLRNDTLTFSGIGKMKDYGIFTTPWGEAYGSITTVVIHPGVTNIGEGICRNCFKLTSVTCYAETPPALEGEVFDGTSKDIVLYVPANAVSAYKANENWKNSFANILAIQEK